MEDFFSQMWAVMTGGTIYNLIILIFAVVSLITSYYFYKKSIRRASAAYAIRTIRLISSNLCKLPAIDISHDSQRVSTLSISKVALWNDGSDTINADSIAKNNTLRIEIDASYEIFGADIQYLKNPSNDFRIHVAEDHRSVKIDFDYFDREEGVVLQLYHSGQSSSDLSIVGQIKACNRIRRIKPYSTAPMPMPDFKVVDVIRINNKEYRISSYKAMQIYGFVILVMAAIMCFFSLREVWYEPVEPVAKDPFLETLWVILFSAIYGFVGYQVIRRRVPKGFDIFNEEF